MTSRRHDEVFYVLYLPEKNEYITAECMTTSSINDGHETSTYSLETSADRMEALKLETIGDTLPWRAEYGGQVKIEVLQVFIRVIVEKIDT